MDELLSYGKSLGLNPVDISQALKLGRPLSESNWCLAADGSGQSREMAREVFEAGRYVEFQCYDHQFKEQGKALVKLLSWEDADGGWFNAEHISASDPYYEYYAQKEATKGMIFHLCEGKANVCKKKLARGDRREVIHVDQWRLMSPQTMVETLYLRDLGKQLGRQVLDQTLADAQRPVLPGTGLDAALLGARDPPEAVGRGREKERKSPEAERRRSRSAKKHKRLRDHVEAQEKRKRDARKDEDKKDAKEKKKRKKKKEKKKKSSSDSTSRSSGSSSSASLFRRASARGGDLWRLAEKKPGRLTESGLKEMARYLAGQSENPLDKSAWGSMKVLAYLNQIVLANHPPSKIGIRAHRELVTLCTCLDLLMVGESVRCMDVLMQRLKAVEMSVHDGGWNLARHCELIPPAGAQLSRESERELAQKAELRQQKLKEATNKLGKSK